MIISEKYYLRPTGICAVKQFARDPGVKGGGFYYSADGTAISLGDKSKPLEDKKPNQISIESRKKMRNSLNNLYAISDIKKVYSKATKKSFSFKLNFITLTLSSEQKHSDVYIKRNMLEPIIKWLQYNHKMNSYVWKAEPQNNGNIHFHITTNIFIHYAAIRNKWNDLQGKHNYIPDKYTMIEDDVPNSTDIHSIRNAAKCIMYMQKYLTKLHEKKKYMSLSCEVGKSEYYKRSFEWLPGDDGYLFEHKRMIDGQYWNCSLNLKQAPASFETEQLMYSAEFNKWVHSHSRKILFNEFATMIYTDHESMLQLPKRVRKYYTRYIDFMKLHEHKKKYYSVESL